MSKITLTRAELLDALCDAEEIDSGYWRWGKTSRIRIERDGKSYAAWIRSHYEDGIQIDGDVMFAEVVPIEKTIVVWEVV